MVTYEMVVAGTASPLVVAAFDDFAITPMPGGRLRMTGSVRDEAGLHGVLHRLQLLGLTIMEVRRIEDEGDSGPRS